MGVWAGSLLLAVGQLRSLQAEKATREAKEKAEAVPVKVSDAAKN
jgi:hypothetical protein